MMNVRRWDDYLDRLVHTLNLSHTRLGKRLCDWFEARL